MEGLGAVLSAHFANTVMIPIWWLRTFGIEETVQ